MKPISKKLRFIVPIVTGILLGGCHGDEQKTQDAATPYAVSAASSPVAVSSSVAVTSSESVNSSREDSSNTTSAKSAHYAFTVGRDADAIVSMTTETNAELLARLNAISFRGVDIGSVRRTADFSDLTQFLRAGKYHGSGVLLGVTNCRDKVSWKNQMGVVCAADTGGEAVIVPNDERSRAFLYNAKKLGEGLVSGKIVGLYLDAPVIEVSSNAAQIAKFNSGSDGLQASLVEKVRSYLDGHAKSLREGVVFDILVPSGADAYTGVDNNYILVARSDNLSESTEFTHSPAVRVQFARIFLGPVRIGGRETPIAKMNFFVDIGCDGAFLSGGPQFVSYQSEDDVTDEYASLFPLFHKGMEMSQFSSVQQIVKNICSSDSSKVSINSSSTETADANALVLNKPSFDCNKAASPSENIICRDPDLALADRELAPLITQAQTVSHDKSALRDRLRKMWEARQMGCKDKDCVTKWYAYEFYVVEKIIATGDPNSLGPNPMSLMQAKDKLLDEHMDGFARVDQYNPSGESGSIVSAMIDNWSHPRDADDWKYLEELDRTAVDPNSTGADACGADGGGCRWLEPFEKAERNIRSAGLHPLNGTFEFQYLNQLELQSKK